MLRHVLEKMYRNLDMPLHTEAHNVAYIKWE